MPTEVISLDFLLSGAYKTPVADVKPKDDSTKSIKTLESYHSAQITKIANDKLRVEEFKKELIDKKKKLHDIDNAFNEPIIINSNILTLTIHQKLEQEIQELEDKIAKLSSREAEIDYFMRVGDILFSYSDAQERIAAGEKPIENTGKKIRMPSNSVYSYFTATTNNETPVINPIEITQIKHNKASDITNDLGFKRDKAFESYLCALNPDAIQNENSIASSITEDFGNCPNCNTEMLMNETFLDCSTCGYRDFILIDSEKPSYKDPPREMSYYAYKKINHLNECLAQFQAKETTEIPTHVLDMIRAELKKERITDMSKLKPSKLKEVIKKLKLNKCYDHVAHVLNRLNGISAPVLPREVEEKLRFMFKEIQFSFVKHCPKKRSNFLSYHFVLYKFCELLELDEYLPCFPLLKSREKLYMQDKIWQKICDDMRWQFIRTV